MLVSHGMAVGRAGVLLWVLGLGLTFSGCWPFTEGVTGPTSVQEAVDALKWGISALQDESQAWRDTMLEVERRMRELGLPALADEAKGAMLTAIGATGGEAKCTMDFACLRLRTTLENMLAQLLGKPELVEAAPAPCNHDLPGTLALDKVCPVEQCAVQSFNYYGYDFASTNVEETRIRIVLVAKDKHETDVTEVTRQIASPYMVIRVCDNRLPLCGNPAQWDKLEVKWSDHTGKQYTLSQVGLTWKEPPPAPVPPAPTCDSLGEMGLGTEWQKTRTSNDDLLMLLRKTPAFLLEGLIRACGQDRGRPVL